MPQIVSNMQSSFNSQILFSRRGNNGSDEYQAHGEGELGPEPFFPDNQSTDQSHPPTYTVVTPSSTAKRSGNVSE